MNILGIVLFVLASIAGCFAIIMNLCGDTVKKVVYSSCPKQIIRGYKGFEDDLTCNGFQYRIGEVFGSAEFPVPNKQGFHFCKQLKNVFQWYPPYPNARNVYCEIEAIGRVSKSSTEQDKFCTDCIRIVRMLQPQEVAEIVKQEGGTEFQRELDDYAKWIFNWSLTE